MLPRRVLTRRQARFVQPRVRRTAQQIVIHLSRAAALLRSAPRLHASPSPHPRVSHSLDTRLTDTWYQTKEEEEEEDAAAAAAAAVSMTQCGRGGGRVFHRTQLCLASARGGVRATSNATTRPSVAQGARDAMANTDRSDSNDSSLNDCTIESILIPTEERNDSDAAAPSSCSTTELRGLVQLLIDADADAVESVPMGLFVAMQPPRQLRALCQRSDWLSVICASESFHAHRDTRQLRLAGIRTLSAWAAQPHAVPISDYSRGELQRAHFRAGRGNGTADGGGGSRRRRDEVAPSSGQAVLAWLSATIQRAVRDEVACAVPRRLLPHANPDGGVDRDGGGGNRIVEEDMVSNENVAQEADADADADAAAEEGAKAEAEAEVPRGVMCTADTREGGGRGLWEGHDAPPANFAEVEQVAGAAEESDPAAGSSRAPTGNSSSSTAAAAAHSNACDARAPTSAPSCHPHRAMRRNARRTDQQEDYVNCTLDEEEIQRLTEDVDGVEEDGADMDHHTAVIMPTAPSGVAESREETNDNTRSRVSYAQETCENATEQPTLSAPAVHTREKDRGVAHGSHVESRSEPASDATLLHLAELMLRQFNSADGYLHRTCRQHESRKRHTRATDTRPVADDGDIVVVVDGAEDDGSGEDTAHVDTLALFSAYHAARVTARDPMPVRALKYVWNCYNAHQTALEGALDQIKSAGAAGQSHAATPQRAALWAAVARERRRSVETLVYGAALMRTIAREVRVALPRDENGPDAGLSATSRSEKHHTDTANRHGAHGDDEDDGDGSDGASAELPAYGFPLLSSDTRHSIRSSSRSAPSARRAAAPADVTDMTVSRVAQAVHAYTQFFAHPARRATPFRPNIAHNAGCGVAMLTGSTLHLYETSLKQVVRENAVRICFAEALLGVLHVLRLKMLPEVNTVHFHILVTDLTSTHGRTEEEEEEEEEGGTATTNRAIQQKQRDSAEAYDDAQFAEARSESGTTIVGIDLGGLWTSSERARLTALAAPLGLAAEMEEFTCVDDLVSELESALRVSVVHDLLQTREDLNALLTPTLVQLLPGADGADETETEWAPSRGAAADSAYHESNTHAHVSRTDSTEGQECDEDGRYNDDAEEDGMSGVGQDDATDASSSAHRAGAASASRRNRRPRRRRGGARRARGRVPCEANLLHNHHHHHNNNNISSSSSDGTDKNNDAAERGSTADDNSYMSRDRHHSDEDGNNNNERKSSPTKGTASYAAVTQYHAASDEETELANEMAALAGDDVENECDKETQQQQQYSNSSAPNTDAECIDEDEYDDGEAAEEYSTERVATTTSSSPPAHRGRAELDDHSNDYNSTTVRSSFDQQQKYQQPQQPQRHTIGTSNAREEMVLPRRGNAASALLLSRTARVPVAEDFYDEDEDVNDRTLNGHTNNNSSNSHNARMSGNETMSIRENRPRAATTGSNEPSATARRTSSRTHTPSPVDSSESHLPRDNNNAAHEAAAARQASNTRGSSIQKISTMNHHAIPVRHGSATVTNRAAHHDHTREAHRPSQPTPDSQWHLTKQTRNVQNASSTINNNNSGNNTTGDVNKEVKHGRMSTVASGSGTSQHEGRNKDMYAESDRQAMGTYDNVGAQGDNDETMSYNAHTTVSESAPVRSRLMTRDRSHATAASSASIVRNVANVHAHPQRTHSEDGIARKEGGNERVETNGLGEESTATTQEQWFRRRPKKRYF